MESSLDKSLALHKSLIAIQLINKHERKVWDILNPTIPVFTTLGHILTSTGQVKQMLVISKIIFFFANNFWIRKGSEKRETLSYFSHWDASKCMHSDPKTSINKLTLGWVKWPDIMNDPGRSCYILVDASWQYKHNDTSSTALTIFCNALLA